MMKRYLRWAWLILSIVSLAAEASMSEAGRGYTHQFVADATKQELPRSDREIMGSGWIIGRDNMADTFMVAVEIYHWIDENGVANFSQQAPSGEVSGLNTLTLPDTAPSDYDPEEDRFGVQEQAERMKAMREEMEQRRVDSRERQKNAPQQVIVQYPERSYPLGYRYPYIPHKPPPEPELPIEETRNVSTFIPLRSTPD